MTNTSNQTKKLSQVRDYVEVSEVPIFNVEISILTNNRTIDANKLGIDSDALNSLPEHIHTKLAQALVPARATRPLLSIRKSVQDFLKRTMVEQKPFGYVCGHENAIKHEEFLLKKQDEFYAAMMTEEDYNKECERIIHDLTHDPILMKEHWHDRFVELSKSRQPTWETYCESCDFNPKAHFIGESGSASTIKLKTANETFSDICKGTKEALVDEIAKTSHDILGNIAKQKQDNLIQEKTWQRMYELADKLSSLSFVSRNIAMVEQELREMLNSFLPKAGSISGHTKSNFVTILSSLVDPFALSDKINNQTPLFKEVTITGSIEDLEVEQAVEESKPTTSLKEVEAAIAEADEEEMIVEEITALPVIDAEEILVSEEEFNQLDENEGYETSADEFINEFADMDQILNITEVGDEDDVLASLGF